MKPAFLIFMAGEPSFKEARRGGIAAVSAGSLLMQTAAAARRSSIAIPEFLGAVGRRG